VNGRVLGIAIVCAVLVGGALFLIVNRSRPASPPRTAAPASGSTVDAPKPAEPSKPAARSTKPESRADAAPATRPSAEPEPAAAPVAPATVGTLRIDSDVAGAQVFLDRQLAGRTPVTIHDVSPGTHRLNVSAEGFEGTAETIDVSPGERDIMVRLREVRLNVSLAVVHKHRLGSCSGQLVATPQGLRYDTAESKDGFASTLADLETFEVDYLQKNLRIKPRGGKEHNFTDPEGNADRLFVFHRDVSKARDRLAKGDKPGTE
jgi:hypothetical protein